jgi:hypothetical protein
VKLPVTVRPKKQAPPPEDPNDYRTAPAPPPEEQVLPPSRGRTRRPNDRFFTRNPTRRKEADAAQLAADVAAYDAMAAQPIPPRPRHRPPVVARSAGELALANDRRKGVVE